MKRLPVFFKPKQPWKVAFFLLLGMIVLPKASVLFRMFRPSNSQPMVQSVEPLADQQSMVEITLTKEMLETLLNQAMQHSNLAAQESMTVTVTESIVQLESSTQIVGITVPVTVASVPYVTEEGAVQLKISTVQVSGFHLPVSVILSMLANQKSIPSWLEVDPKNEFFTIHLSQLYPDMTIKAKKIDLKANECIFSVSISNDNIVKYLQK